MRPATEWALDQLHGGVGATVNLGYPSGRRVRRGRVATKELSVRRSSTRNLGTGAVVLALLVSGLPAASANTGNSSVEGAAELIEQVAPDQGRVAYPTPVDETVQAAGADGKVTIPLDPDATIAIEGTGVASVPVLEVNLPEEITVSGGQVARDGTVVYEGLDGGASAAVQALEGGSARVQTITPDAGGPHEFTYTFAPGVTPVLAEDGTVELLQEVSDGMAMSVGGVAEPWAFDVNGKPVDTAYAIVGDSLVQTIQADDETVYPVVADPMFTQTWWNMTLYFNRTETKAVAVAAGGTSRYLSAVPQPYQAVLKIAMATYSGTFALYDRTNRCGKFVWYRLANVVPSPQPYGGSEAGGYCR